MRSEICCYPYRREHERRHACVPHLDALPAAPEAGHAAAVEAGGQQADERTRRQRVAGRLVVGQMAAAGVFGHFTGREERQRGPPHPNDDDERHQAERAQCPAVAAPPVCGQPVQEVQHERKGQEEQHLAVPGQRGHRQDDARASSPARAPTGQRAMGQEQEERQPGRRRVEIQVADVGDEQVGEGKGDPAHERSRPAQAQSSRQREHARTSQPDVEDDERLHHAVGRLTEEGEGEQVGRVEDARLVVGDERDAAMEVGVPEGNEPGAQAAGSEAVHRPEEGDQVAAAARDPLAGEDERPEEGEDDERQEKQGGYVKPVILRLVPCVRRDGRPGFSRGIPR